jgi:lipoate-protein ligase B
LRVVDLGRIAFSDALELQLRTREEVLGGAESTLFLLEHEPVYTLGANFHAENLLVDEALLRGKGFDVVPADRGGDITFHGPGQLVAYPVFDLQPLGRDLHKWIRQLEAVVLRLLDDLGFEGRRFPPNTGVWVQDEKVAAIGIKVSRWVSTHGLAINCDNDLSPFENIVPCGIAGYGVTSLSRVTGRSVSVREAKGHLVEAFAQEFGFDAEASDFAASL